MREARRHACVCSSVCVLASEQSTRARPANGRLHVRAEPRGQERHTTNDRKEASVMSALEGRRKRRSVPAPGPSS